MIHNDRNLISQLKKFKICNNNNTTRKCQYYMNIIKLQIKILQQFYQHFVKIKQNEVVPKYS